MSGVLWHKKHPPVDSVFWNKSILNKENERFIFLGRKYPIF